MPLLYMTRPSPPASSSDGEVEVILVHSPAHEAAREAEDRRRQEQEDEALAQAIAVSEEEAAAPGPGDAAAGRAWQAPYDRQLALSLADQELAELGSRHSRELSLLPQLLPESPLGQQLARSLSGVLAQASERLVQPTVNRPFDHYTAPSPVSPDRSRLELRLGMYGLVERTVKGDGACQFRALSDQLYRTPRLHAFVRFCIVQQLRQHPELYKGFVPGEFGAYCYDMQKPGTWGDHVTLQAAADYFQLRISLVTSFESSAFLEILPQPMGFGGPPSATCRTLWLSFWAEVHYNSVWPEAEPPPELPSEKLLGSRRLYNLLHGAPSPLK